MHSTPEVRIGSSTACSICGLLGVCAVIRRGGLAVELGDWMQHGKAKPYLQVSPGDLRAVPHCYGQHLTC